jgi:hypothetical protein
VLPTLVLLVLLAWALPVSLPAPPQAIKAALRLAVNVTRLTVLEDMFTVYILCGYRLNSSSLAAVARLRKRFPKFKSSSASEKAVCHQFKPSIQKSVFTLTGARVNAEGQIRPHGCLR